MCCQLFALPDTTVQRLRAEPALLARVLSPDDEPPTPPPRRSWWRRVLGRARPPALASEAPLVADLDKAWHGIHYLLTQRAYDGDAPWSFLLCGEIDLAGDGMTLHAHRAAQVHAFHTALAALPDHDLRARFDVAAMAELEIYPDVWRRPGADDELDYLMENVASLRRFLEEADAARLGCLVAIG